MFKASGGVFAALAALVLAGWLLSNSNKRDARDSAISAGVGLLIYFAYRLTRVKAPDRGSDTTDENYQPEA
jgi:hypothetical protein